MECTTVHNPTAMDSSRIQSIRSTKGSPVFQTAVVVVCAITVCRVLLDGYTSFVSVEPSRNSRRPVNLLPKCQYPGVIHSRTPTTHATHTYTPRSNQTEIYVVSLQGVPGADAQNAGRLDQFRQDWDGMCGHAVPIKFCPGTLNKAGENTGHGLTRAFLRCFEQAYLDGARNPVFLEDDARLYHADFCNGRDWSDVPVSNQCTPPPPPPRIGNNRNHKRQKKRARV